MLEAETLPDINPDRSLADINPGCSYVKILKRIPRSSLVSVARKLSSILHDDVWSNDCVSWEDLFLFACRCLPSPHRGGHRRNLARIVNEAVESERKELPPSTLICNPLKPYDPPKTLAACVACKLEEGDFKGAVRLACSSSESIAPDDDNLLQLLKDKHQPPHSESVIPPFESSDRHLEVHFICCYQGYLLLSSWVSWKGVDPQHLKDVITSPYRQGSLDLISVLAGFVNLVLAGKVPPTVRPYFFGASLIGLGKKDGGVRPIAIGGTLRRLVAKCAVLLIKEDIGSLLFPTLLGFGTCRGVKGAVHGARNYLSNLEDGKLLLKLDFRNAFNSIQRDKMLEATLAMSPCTDLTPSLLMQCTASPYTCSMARPLLSHQRVFSRETRWSSVVLSCYT